MAKIKLNKWIVIFSVTIILGMIGCDKDNQGIDLAVRNFTKDEYVMKVKIDNQEGYSLYDLSIPLEKHTQIPFFYYQELDCQFDRFVIKTTLEKHDGNIVAGNIGFWPGNAGISNGASSNRVLVEMSIAERHGKININFEGIL